jgi:hypothetical protein
MAAIPIVLISINMILNKAEIMNANITFNL